MQPTTITIENLQIKNNVFLAPLAGYTDYAFRKLMLERGVGLCFTELVSAKGLMYDSQGSKELLYAGNDYENTAVQIFGSEPYYMRSACESEYLAPFKIVDINMGCPVPKVYKNGEGSALLNDIKKAEEIIKECKKSGKIITIKIRTGQKKGDDIATEFAKMAEGVGASLVTIHGRVREDYYSGEPDFNAIEKAKKSVKIPIIANGGIFTREDAENMVNRTGADGIMLARGAIADPFLASNLTNTKIDKTLKDFIIEHIKLMASRYDNRRATNEFKKFIPYYFKGIPNLKDLKMQIYSADSTEKILNLLQQFF
ncbi:MAG: tRNA-dihydrouridine synthase family protein [Clostridia bacterium]|nr:tRNA-dihydrouridine synthase family protein [Clostridia bacterium]